MYYPNILCNVRRAQIFIVDYCYTIIIIVVVINTDFAMDGFSMHIDQHNTVKGKEGKEERRAFKSIIVVLVYLIYVKTLNSIDISI